MAYTPFFSGNSSAPAASTKNSSGYISFFGSPTIAQPSPDELAQRRQQQQTKPATMSKPSAKPKSFLTKLASGAKSFASSATTGEQKLAQGVARVLPGGSNDLTAEQQSSQADQQAGQTYAQLHKAGKLSDAQYKKATATVAGQANQTSKQVKATEKSMPTKAQIALGAASTAADIATAGTFSKGKAGLTSSKALVPLFSGTTKKVAAKEVATQVASNAAAGGLNAAAGGGKKGDIIKNAAAGAALPVALDLGGEVARTVGSKVADKVSTKPAKELATNVRTQSVLEKLASKQEAKQSKAAVMDLPTLSEDQLSKSTTPAKVPEVAAPVTRPVEQIKTDIQTNADHVKTITGKSPDSFITHQADGSTKINPDTPKSAVPYLEKHQELQKEYIGVTSPSPKVATSPNEPTLDTTSASETPTRQAGLESATAAPENKPAVPPVAKESANVSSANSTPEAATATDRGVSKVAQDVQTKAVARGLKNDFGEAGGYDKITLADQAKKAVALTNDKPALDKVISGEAPLPDGLRATALIKAVENHPVLGRDPEMIRKLSQAEHLTGESSKSAQELRLAAERNPTSPVEAARKVREARIAAVEKRSGKSVNSQLTNDVKMALAAKPKVTRQTWSEFVDSIKC